MSSLNVLLGYNHAGNHYHSGTEDRRSYMESDKCVITSCMNLRENTFDSCHVHKEEYEMYNYSGPGYAKSCFFHGQTKREYIEMMNSGKVINQPFYNPEEFIKNNPGVLCERETGIMTCRKCVITDCPERLSEKDEESYRLSHDDLRGTWMCPKHRMVWFNQPYYIAMMNNGEVTKGWMYYSKTDGNYKEYYHRLVFNLGEVELHQFLYYYDDRRNHYEGTYKYKIDDRELVIRLDSKFVEELFRRYHDRFLGNEFHNYEIENLYTKVMYAAARRDKFKLWDYIKIATIFSRENCKSLYKTPGRYTSLKLEDIKAALKPIFGGNVSFRLYDMNDIWGTIIDESLYIRVVFEESFIGDRKTYYVSLQSEFMEEFYKKADIFRIEYRRRLELHIVDYPSATKEQEYRGLNNVPVIYQVFFN